MTNPQFRHEEMIIYPNQYYVTIVTGFVENFMVGGLDYGWPVLSTVLKKEGYFYNYCDKHEEPLENVLDTSLLSNIGSQGYHALHDYSNGTGRRLLAPAGGGDPKIEDDFIVLKTCEKQANLYDDIYLYTKFTDACCKIPFGFLEDSISNWYTRFLAAFLFLIACICMIVATLENGWSIIPGLFLFAVSGHLFYLSNMKASNLFADRRPFVICLLSGAADSSSAMMLLVSISYDWGYHHKMMFSLYCILPFLTVFRTIYYTPRGKIPFPLGNHIYKYGRRDLTCFPFPKVICRISFIYTLCNFQVKIFVNRSAYTLSCLLAKTAVTQKQKSGLSVKLQVVFMFCLFYVKLIR